MQILSFVPAGKTKAEIMQVWLTNTGNTPQAQTPQRCVPGTQELFLLVNTAIQGGVVNHGIGYTELGNTEACRNGGGLNGFVQI